jgi:hypothetical protein
MARRRTSRIAWKAAVFALLGAATLWLATASAGARGLTLARAEHAARQTVLQHPSYRQIGTARSPLATRDCWRVSARTARCSLFVVVPSPCALDPQAELCAQARWQRRWLVEVKRDAGGSVAARVVRISSSPAPAAPGSP